MANALYDKGREGFLNGSIDWDTDTIRVLMMRSSGGGGGPYYTKNLATDDFQDDLPDNTDARPLGTGISTGEVLGSKTTTDGVADAADITFSSVASGDAIQELVGYKDTAVQTTSNLIFNLDTATGLPVTPNGGDIQVQWDAGSNRIFKL